MADPAAPTRSSLDDDVLSTARADIRAYHDEQQKRRLEAPDVPTAVNAGCTIFLGHQDLTNLPEELVDIIKDEVERLALNQNRLTSLSGLGPRFSECTRLKYLVMRDNELRDFPAPILSVPTLEVLDLKGNKIKTLPEDLNKLCNLRNFSIKRNRVERLPLCIGTMKNLLSFTTRRNDIRFPPREEWAVEEIRGDNDEDDKARDTDREKLETQKLKRVLLEYAAKGRLKESVEETNESNAETPRPPARRAISGRFPIKPSVDLSTLPAPASPPTYKPPPIPTKGISRLVQKPLTAAIRPRIEPLVSPNSERNRSNSESQMSLSSRAAKRMGFMARKTSDAQVKFDVKKTNRLSHNRGLSHGSALQHGANNNDSSSPVSPVEEHSHAVFGRRLSSLPENQRKSRIQDPQVELSQGLLFAMVLLHSPVQQLVGLVGDGGSKRTSLERTSYNAYTFVDDLSKQLKLIQTDHEEEEERPKSSTPVQETSLACIQAFEQLAASFQRHAPALVQRASPQYVRILMHMLYASVVEIRNACSKFGIEFQSPSRSSQSSESWEQEQQYSPTTVRPTTSVRVGHQPPQINGRALSPRSPRSPRAHRNAFAGRPSRRPIHNNSRSTTNTNYSSNRTASEASSPFGTGPSPSLTRSNTMTSIDEHGEDQQFEQIFLKLCSACRYATDSMPRINQILYESRSLAIGRENEGVANDGEVAKCDEALTAGREFLEATDSLQTRLTTMRSRESRAREQLEFWQCVTAFTNYFENFARMVKTLTHLGLIVNASPNSSVSMSSFSSSHRDGQRTPGSTVRALIKPILHHAKEAGKLINDSPWQGLAVGPGQAPLTLPAKQLAFSPPSNSSSSTFISHSQLPSQNGLSNGHYQGQFGVHHQNSGSINTFANPSYGPLTSTANRSTPPLSLQTRNMPPPTALNTEPSSAVSTHSTSSQGFLSSGYTTPASGLVASGYVTPLPATPLSAALGPAIQATVPGGSISGPSIGLPQLQPPLFSASINGNGVYGANGGNVSSAGGANGTGGISNWPERSRSLSQQRR